MTRRLRGNSTEEVPTLQHAQRLGYAFFTSFYDFALAILTREKYLCRLLVDILQPEFDDFILDVRSGAGNLAIAVHRRQPVELYVGLDPDAEAVRRGRKKARRYRSTAIFLIGCLHSEELPADLKPNKIVGSLALHQMPLNEKKRVFKAMSESLMPGGKTIVADYGLQGSRLSKLLFGITVQALRGVTDTQPNADGKLPTLLLEAGFDNIQETHRIPTLTGVISIYSCSKPTNSNAALS